MPTTLLEVQKETIPIRENAVWMMCEIDTSSKGIAPMGVRYTYINWYFTLGNAIHDEPGPVRGRRWEGTWEQVSADKIVIHRTDLDDHLPYEYEVTFVSFDTFVAHGADDIPDRVLLGIKMLKEEIPSNLEKTNTNWSVFDIYPNSTPTSLKKNDDSWCFTTPENKIHNEPKTWEGSWEKVSTDKIVIHRKNPDGLEINYDTKFVSSDAFVAIGSEEPGTCYVRILLGILQE